ncbi:PE family protein [Mycobacterium sp.]|uniref:PE family protein n=1 Tax=Mycobacterium sp. TaxID=1785 RepID=UPI003C7351D3
MVPDIVTAAAGNLADIGSAMTAANAAAATPTTGLVAMASDEVSAAVTAVFSSHAQAYQNLGAQAAAFHDAFVRTLSGGAGAYLATEFANVQQNLLDAVNGPAAAVANAAESSTQSFNYPFGPLNLSGSFTSNTDMQTGAFSSSGYAAATLNTPLGHFTLLGLSGNAGLTPNGPAVFSANGTSPYGPVAFSLNGNTVANMQTQMLDVQFTNGSLLLPTAVPLIAAEYGPLVVGGQSLLNSGSTFFTALGNGDYLGAASAYVTAPLNYTGAVLFGHTTVTVPDPSWLGALGSSSGIPQLHIPFGGIFASTAPITVSIPSTTSDQGFNLIGSEFPLVGTEFGGLVPVLLNAVGLHTS